jgi:hypothetical protein
MEKILICLGIVVCLSACGGPNIKVSPVPEQENIQSVCIMYNPRVAIDGFESDIASNLTVLNIKSRRVSSSNQQCSYTLDYSARKSWDFTPYIGSMEFIVSKGDELIGSASYKQSNNFNLSKWGQAEEAMSEMFRELFNK